jgi:hypothetical protein
VKSFCWCAEPGDELGEFKELSERESERVATLETALAKQKKETSQKEAAASRELLLLQEEFETLGLVKKQEVDAAEIALRRVSSKLAQSDEALAAASAQSQNLSESIAGLQVEAKAASTRLQAALDKKGSISLSTVQTMRACLVCAFLTYL